jgi:hypothetical protein
MLLSGKKRVQTSPFPRAKRHSMVILDCHYLGVARQICQLTYVVRVNSISCSAALNVRSSCAFSRNRLRSRLTAV